MNSKILETPKDYNFKQNERYCLYLREVSFNKSVELNI
jgi:hypothetical protein